MAATARQMEIAIGGAEDALSLERRNCSADYPDGFFAWLDANREIWRAFTERALAVRRSGRTRFSARMIMENIRWNTLLRDKDVTFKINNNIIPGLARLAMRLHPELEGMFELREAHGAEGGGS